MGITGKYDFKGIQSKGALGLKALFSSTVWLSWVPTSLLELFVNWIANEGLIIMNIGAIYVKGEVDQVRLDSAIDEGIRAMQSGALTPEQIKEIDDKVIAAADSDLPYGDSN